MYIEFILGIFLCILILASLPTKSKVKIENVDCILTEKLKDKKFKKLYEKEVKKLTKTEEKMKKKLLAEGYKEMAKEVIDPEKVTKSYTSVDEMLDDLHSHRDWNILDYLYHYWHIYFWNYVSDIPLRVKTFVQRGVRGWADSDTWCFDYYLSKVIAEGVKHLIMYGNSCWSDKDKKDLFIIVKTFEIANEINEHNLIYTPSKKFTWSAYKKQKRTCEFMNKKRSYPRDKKYRVMTLREVLKFEKGFDIFKEKFFFLWD